MRLLIDLFPLIAFVVSYKLGGIYAATAVLIAATLLQIGIHWWRTHTVKPIHWITALLVLIFGSATLLLHDPRFIKLKLTVLMWSLSIAFLVSQFVGRKPLTRRYFEAALGEELASVPAAKWGRLNLLWIVFFALVGALNLYVAQQFSENTWVNFKAYGVTGLMLVFLLPQVLWLGAHHRDDARAGDSHNQS